MKILFVTTAPLVSNSSASIQNVALIRGFLELGHEVYTLTTFTEDDSLSYDCTLGEDLAVTAQYFVSTSTVYKALSGNKKNRSGIHGEMQARIKKVLRSMYWRWQIYDGLKTAVSNVDKVNMPATRFDVMISSSDPRSSHLLAEAFLKLNPGSCGRWIQYWGDPMYLDISTRPFFPWRLKREESRIINLADEVIYVSPLTYEAQKRLYPELAHKMRFVPLAYIEPKFYFERKSNGLPIVGYYGFYLSKVRDIQPLYEATKRHCFRLRIVGTGDIDLKTNELVEIRGRVSYEEVCRLEEDTDILACVCNHKSTQIPGKIYYYAATNRPVLVILDGFKDEIRRFLEPFHRFVFCNNDAEDIARAVREISECKADVVDQPLQEFSAANIAAIVLESGASFQFPIDNHPKQLFS